MKCVICKKESEKDHDNICRECWLNPKLIGTHELMERDKRSRLIFAFAFIVTVTGLALEITGNPNWMRLLVWSVFAVFPAFYVVLITAYVRKAQHTIELMLNEKEKRSESQRWYLGPRERA